MPIELPMVAGFEIQGIIVDLEAYLKIEMK